MADSLENLLHTLSERPSDRDLSGMEHAVWSRIAERGRGNAFGTHPMRLQMVLSCVALLIGMAVAQFMHTSPTVRTEIAVSSDGALRPSVLLMGGA